MSQQQEEQVQNYIRTLQHDHAVYSQNLQRLLTMLAPEEAKEKDYEAMTYLAIMMRADLSSTANFLFHMLDMLKHMKQEEEKAQCKE